jgi:hypothetical protein
MGCSPPVEGTLREPKVFFIDDDAGKPVGINLFIGKRPYAAFGNSLRDKQMLEWTQAGDGARLMMLALHDDPEGDLSVRQRVFTLSNNRRTT